MELTREGDRFAFRLETPLSRRNDCFGQDEEFSVNFVLPKHHLGQFNYVAEIADQHVKIRKIQKG